jgi:hypothetical protein
MAGPDVRAHLRGLVGETIPTISGAPNAVLEVRATEVVVGTRRSPQGQAVPLAWVQGAVDRVYDGEEVEISPASVGYRSAFVGATLRSMPDVEVRRHPQRARLRRLR